MRHRAARATARATAEARREYGTTAVELVVASALMLLALGLALPVVATAQRAANRVITVGGLHADGRSVMTEVVRRLRSARPAGVCLDPPGASAEGCLLLGTRQATILQATGDRVCFASVPNAVGTPPPAGTSARDVVLPAPELVCLGRDVATGIVSVSTWRPKAVDDCLAGPQRQASYTTPCWDYPSPARSLEVGRVDPRSPPPFAYFDAAGGPLFPPGPAVLDSESDDRVLAPTCSEPVTTCLVTKLAQIVTVRIDLRLAARASGRVQAYDIHISVVPRGGRYSREQIWAVGQ